MAKIKGICRNIDGCDLAAEKVEQEKEKTEFFCEECGKPLCPIEDKKKSKPKNYLPLIIVGVIAGVAIIAGCIFAFSGGSNEDPQLVATDTVPANEVATEPDTVIKRDTVVVRDTIVQNNTVTTNEKVTTKTVVSTTAPAKSNVSSNSGGSGTLRLGFANYTGATKSGRAHGQGRMVFTSSHIIDSRDSKGRVADAGDYVIGEWNNGNLVQGRWYGADGNVKGSIIIGM